jgi:hypothetical protein
MQGKKSILQLQYIKGQEEEEEKSASNDDERVILPQGSSSGPLRLA